MFVLGFQYELKREENILLLEEQSHVTSGVPGVSLKYDIGSLQSINQSIHHFWDIQNVMKRIAFSLLMIERAL
jgi:hypothetical protein